MLFPAAAFAVHQLRYELAYGSRAGAALSAQGHGYLTSLGPFVAVLVALALGSFLTRLARAGGERLDGRPRRAFAELWLVASACLLATYSLQECLEGIFAAGHPGGFTGVFGHGGWWAILLSVAAGLVVAALLRVAAAVAEILSRVAPPVSSATLRLVVRLVSVSLLRRAPLADASAGRAPPGVRLAA
jgi:hypothetical protein